jgi:hypothetical protein
VERHTAGSANWVPPEHGRAEFFIYVRLLPSHKERMWSGLIGLFLARERLSVLSAFSCAGLVPLLFSGCGASAFLRCHGTDLCYGTATVRPHRQYTW